jgi:hypothetical protein
MIKLRADMSETDMNVDHDLCFSLSREESEQSEERIQKNS